MKRLLQSPLGLLLGPAIALSAAAVVLLADADTGALPLARLQEQVREARAQVADLEGERKRLVVDIQSLRKDPLAVETVARRQLGMVRPGEIVVRWE